jgi:hypothetical protein
MKHTWIICLFMMSEIQLFAQTQLQIDATQLNDNVNIMNGYKKSTYVEGTPYLNDNNTVGVFYQKNKTVVNMPTKLNMYYDSFEYMVDEKTYLVKPNAIDSVSINNETYVFENFSIRGEISPKVVKVLDYKGTNRLYIYKGVDLIPEVKPAGYIDPKPARFEWRDPIYIFKINGKIIVLKNFKGIIELYPKFENSIKKYIKENHIRINNPDNLKNLLCYISQIKK